MMKIPVYRNNVHICDSLVDEDTYKVAINYKWGLSRTGYVRARSHKGLPGDGKNITLHSLALNFPKGIIDHINHDKLDNRRSNLRMVNNNQSAWNRTKIKRDTTSKYKGVSLDASSGRWRALIYIEGKCIALYRYDTPEEAAAVYNYKARELFGDYACLNEGVGFKRPERRKITSKYRGVHKHTYNNRWIASIRYKKINIYLGSFIGEIDAARAYNVAAVKYYGDKAKLNII